MGFYEREIKYYKSLKLVDTDGDGVKDALVYRPLTDFYYLPFGMEQDVKDIGYYHEGINQEFEVVDFSGVWDESNDGSNDGYQGGGSTNLPDPSGDEAGTDPLASTEFCNDPNAENYNPTLVGSAGFVPCPNNSCCDYTEPGNYSIGGSDPNNDDETTRCLAIYTDWGPWNEQMLLNDTNQIYVTKTECTLTFRFINEYSNVGGSFGLVPGGWYGSSIRIEVDSGNGFTDLSPSSSSVLNIENDIDFNSSNNRFTLNEKVRIWRAQKTSGQNTLYFSTRPYRDLTLKVSSNSTVRVTYYNSIVADDTLYFNNAKYMRLQIIKGVENTPTPSPAPQLIGTNTLSWAQDTPGINTFLGNPANRSLEGETFHYLSNDLSTSNTLKDQVWVRYLNGDDNPTPTVPWGVNNNNIQVGIFYANQNVNINYDFGDNTSKNILFGSNETSLDDFVNPSELLAEFNFTCLVSTNWVSYFDRNGDGMIESDNNYPTIDNQNQGSVDTGLFSKTRYDSPYIYLKPGTKDGGPLPLVDNALTNNGSGSQSNFPIGPSSVGGWKKYAYVGPGGTLFGTTTYSFANVSPTCQLGGCDNIINTENDLIDPDNYNIFLPQSDDTSGVNNTSCANFGTGTTVNHKWNYGTTDAKSGCCAKKYDPSLTFSTQGPYLDSQCSTCHSQMTTRSAQPVFDNSVRIAMQTTDSDVYYGPFYDPENPTYNGYGLAFSRANKFCREVRGKNGVQIINSEQGVNEDKLFIGGILHGGAAQSTPNTNISDNYGVDYLPFSFETVNNDSNAGCPNFTKLPLKCTKVNNDPNCPNSTCFKCLYCFKCSNELVQPGVFTGDNTYINNGPNGGVSENGGN